MEAPQRAVLQTSERPRQQGCIPRGQDHEKGWADIAAGDHVAQSYAAPSTRGIERDQARAKLKVDLRLYTYAGAILLVAARLYQGQTTNMRTPGGGFAPVLIASDMPALIPYDQSHLPAEDPLPPESACAQRL